MIFEHHDMETPRTFLILPCKLEFDKDKNELTVPEGEVEATVNFVSGVMGVVSGAAGMVEKATAIVDQAKELVNKPLATARGWFKAKVTDLVKPVEKEVY